MSALRPACKELMVVLAEFGRATLFGFAFLLASLVCSADSAVAESANAAPPSGIQALAGAIKTPLIPRHALELEAIKHPEAVLEKLPPALQAEAGNPEQQALLYLAQANACRVMANWNCQRGAGEAALAAARLAGKPHLEVRGLIADARASVALQDFVRGEASLAQAELVLAHAPLAALSAEVQLAYSSFGFALGRFQLSVDYANKGIDVLGRQRSDLSLDLEDELPTKIRLLRNLGRGYAQLGQSGAARTALLEAQGAARALDDPKLLGELHLEAARLGHLMSDVPGQRASGEAVLRLADSLKNSQLRGQGLEALGIAELDAGRRAAALRNLSEALQSFVALKLERDELRVLRRLLPLLIESGLSGVALRDFSQRLLNLGEKIEANDQKKAASDFEARIQALKKAAELQQLQLESKAQLEREALLLSNNRQTRWLAAAACLLALGLGVGIWQALRTRAKIQRSESRLRAITDHLSANVAQIDTEERFVFVNPSLIHSMRRPEADILGNTLVNMIGQDRYAQIELKVRAALTGQDVIFELDPPHGQTKPFTRCHFVPDFNALGKVTGFFAMQVDVTDFKLAQDVLTKLALTDALTGISNRRAFEERMSTALANYHRNRAGIVLLSFDIDRFKQINDGLGHAAGDQVIAAFARRLQSCLREVDFCARLGGDEFVVLIEHAENSAGAVLVAQRVKQALAVPIELNDGGSVLASTSIGIGFARPGARLDAVKLGELADQALYAAKAAGRDGYQIKVLEPLEIQVLI